LHFTNSRQYVSNPFVSPNILYYTVDHSLKYTAFYNDFGPNPMSQVLVFIDRLNGYLRENDRVVLYCSSAPDKRANAAWYLCAYLVGCILAFMLNAERLFCAILMGKNNTF
jgi:hypothetical protein